MRIEDLRLGEDVVSRDGHKVGILSRFVFDRESLRLTHVVVDTGIFRSGEPLWKGGWGISHDRILPFGAVEGHGDGGLRISMSGDEFRELSADFSEEYFTPAPDDRPGWPDASDAARLALSLPGEPGPYLMHEANALTPAQADVPDDAPVWRLRPHEKIGEVERVLYDGESRRITGLVIRRGLFFGKEVVLPAADVVEVVAGVVRVDLDDEALRGLPAFDG